TRSTSSPSSDGRWRSASSKDPEPSPHGATSGGTTASPLLQQPPTLVARVCRHTRHVSLTTRQSCAGAGCGKTSSTPMSTGQLSHEAWWAKRRAAGYHTFADLPANYRSAAGLADAIKDVPCIVFALATGNGPADSVIPAVQNLMLAARAIGIGSVPTTLHPTVMDRFHAMSQTTRDVAVDFCVLL